jgi:hypothetical protein
MHSGCTNWGRRSDCSRKPDASRVNLRGMKAALVLALVTLWPAPRAQACSYPGRCSAWLCSAVTGIARAHDVPALSGEDTKDWRWLVLDEILRAPADNPAFVAGARVRRISSAPTGRPVIVYWRAGEKPDPTLSTDVMAISDAGLVDCEGGLRTHLCPGRPGLTVDQLLALNGTPACFESANQAGYDFCEPPPSCSPFACAVVQAPAGRVPALAALVGLVCLSGALRRRRPRL